jgi:DNA-binding NarL/FixJ family response regulator
MWLKLAPDVRVVGAASDELAALVQVSLLHPDVIVAGIESAGMDGVGLIKAMRKVAPESAVVALSLHDDAITRREAEAAGAVAFASKRDCGDELLRAIRQAARSPRIPSGDSTTLQGAKKAAT